MEFLSTADHNEVLGEWMRCEYQTRNDIRNAIDRYLARSALPSSIIESPSYSNQAENSARTGAALNTWRFPIVGWISSLSWKRAILSRDDVCRLMTLDGAMWQRLTRGTLRLGIFRDLLVTNEGREYLRRAGEAKWVSSVSAAKVSILRNGLRGPMVVVGESRRLQLVDGYHRALAVVTLWSEGLDVEAPYAHVAEGWVRTAD